MSLNIGNCQIAWRGSTVNISRFSQDELRELIERPASTVGINFKPGLVAMLLDRVTRRKESLALLEFVLMEEASTNFTTR